VVTTFDFFFWGALAADKFISVAEKRQVTYFMISRKKLEDKI